MIQKVMSRLETVNKPFVRASMQRKSPLLNLNTRMIRDMSASHDMVIPGGMTRKEEFVYKLTGKFPKSVTERWYEVHGADFKNISSEDGHVLVDSHVLGDTGYTLENGGHYAGSENSSDGGIIDELLDHLLGNG